ncbi:MAG: hypothetical protein ACK4UN_16975 [Limisphaerales bacterium]
MKLRLQTSLWIGIAALSLLAIFAAYKSHAQNTTKEAMRFKLHYAQRVLEGIATENYELIGDNAQRLRRLSQQAEWHIRETPEYQRFTTEFARHADALARAAKNENVDAATVAYFQMTVSCTACHRYLRGAKGASLPLQTPEAYASAQQNFEQLIASIGHE